MKRTIVILAASLLISLPVDAGPQRDRGARAHQNARAAQADGPARGARADQGNKCCEGKADTRGRARARATDQRSKRIGGRRQDARSQRDRAGVRVQQRIRRFAQRPGRSQDLAREKEVRRQTFGNRSTARAKRDSVRSRVREHVTERRRDRKQARSSRMDRGDREKRERSERGARRPRRGERARPGEARDQRVQGSDKEKLQRRIEALKKKRAALQEKLERRRAQKGADSAA